jgi:uncharacterized repeat protein (TIGR01451 family)
VDDATLNNDALVSTGDQVFNADGTATWTLSLAPGATATATVSVTVNNPVTGDKDLHLYVTGDVPGSNCPTGSAALACASHVPVLIPGLVITKTADVTTVEPGGTVAYTITVSNNGETTYPAATFSDSLAAVLTDAVYGDDATATSGTVTYSSPVLSWTGALAPGVSATIEYSATVRDPAPGDHWLRNSVVSSSAGSNCAAGSTDPRCTAVVQVTVPGLTIVKTANVPTAAPGATIGYTVTVTNSGATNYSAATFADPLTGVLDDADYNNDAVAGTGTVGYADSTLTWTGALAPGASTTVTYSVTPRAAGGGDNLVTNTVSSTTPGSNCAASSTDPRCTSTVPVAGLVLTQTADEPTTTPGSTVRLTQTFTNTGQVPYVGISIVSPRGDVADDAIPHRRPDRLLRVVGADRDRHHLDRRHPRRRRRHVHPHAHRQEPRPGQQDHHRHPGVHRPRQQLPPGRHRPALHLHGHRARPRAHHRQGRRHHLHRPRRHRRLHGHGDQQRPDPVRRRLGRRPARCGHRQGDLQRERHREQRNRRLQRADADLDR